MITVDLHCLSEDDLLLLMSALHDTGSDEEPLYEYLFDRLQDLREDQMREDFREAEEAVNCMLKEELPEEIQETEEEESGSGVSIISYHYTISF